MSPSLLVPDIRSDDMSCVLYQPAGTCQLLSSAHQAAGVSHTLEHSEAVCFSLAALSGAAAQQRRFRLSETPATLLNKRYSPESPGTVSSASRQWHERLQELAFSPELTHQSPAELSRFNQFVRSSICDALAAVDRDAVWVDSGLKQYLQRCLRLIDDISTDAARRMALESLGFHAMASVARLRGTCKPDCPEAAGKVRIAKWLVPLSLAVLLSSSGMHQTHILCLMGAYK